MHRRVAVVADDMHSESTRRLAHLNRLLSNMDGEDVIYNDDEHNDDGESERGSDSEDDYELHGEDLSNVTRDVDVADSSAGISVDGIQSAWREQRGVCAISGVVIDVSATGLYAPTPVQRSFARPISDDNVQIVISGVERMRSALTLPWSQFKSFVHQLDTMPSRDV